MSLNLNTPLHPDFSWIQNSPNGLYCEPGNFFLDPKGASHIAVVTHAHGDHYPKGVRTVYATPGTLALKARNGRNDLTHTRVPCEYEKPFMIGEVELRFFPAGHVPGSAQVEMRYKNQRVVYSGDIQTEILPNCEALVYPSPGPGLLICESTFGHSPDHPDPDQELIREIEKAGLRSLLVGTYPLGKSQRITLMMNRLFPDIPVILHPDIYRVSAQLEQMGYPAGKYFAYRRRDIRELGKYVFLIPPRILSSYAANYVYYRLFATGWQKKKSWPWLGGNLHISDHADKKGLRKYIETMNAKAVVWVHGDGLEGENLMEKEAL